MKEIYKSTTYVAESFKDIEDAFNSMDCYVYYLSPNDGNEYEISLDECEDDYNKRIIIITYADRHCSTTETMESMGARVSDFRIERYR